MATIDPRLDKDGNRIGWQARVRKRGYPAQTKTFRVKAEAVAWAKSVETEMERGAWRDRKDAENTTLKEALDRYAEEVTTRKKEQKSELAKIRQWQSRPIASMFLSNVRGREVSEVVKVMEEEGKGGNTIRLHLAVLSHLYTVARAEWGMESLANPVELIRKPKLPTGRDRRLVGNEEERLLASCSASKNRYLKSVVMFALETGMRVDEIIEKTLWEHVDVRKRKVLLIDTKNGTDRSVPLSSIAVATLEALPSCARTGKVFATTYNAIHLAYVRACKRAAITGLTFHDLRHEATSRLFEKGFNPMEVSAITGHKTLQMLKRYTHLRAEDLAKRMG